MAGVRCTFGGALGCLNGNSGDLSVFMRRIFFAYAGEARSGRCGLWIYNRDLLSSRGWERHTESRGRVEEKERVKKKVKDKDKDKDTD